MSVANAPRGATAVTGTFDVMRAEDAGELAGIRSRHPERPLVVVILPLHPEWMPQRARAEMAAALRVIDYVLICDDPHPDALLACLQPAELVRLEEVHAERKRQLTEHVHRRQTS